MRNDSIAPARHPGAISPRRMVVASSIESHPPSDNERPIAHYQKRVRQIRHGEWDAYAGSFGAFLIDADDGRSTPLERQLRMQTVLLRSLDNADEWAVIVDLPNNMVSESDRVYYTSTWQRAA